ncbi:hypothetical protein F2Q69_00024637 [Brassica cretica]|uniref:Uncharacterized protein n=1 Tax=Brassica cretica TaxID=69181 RepID=A0A8S9QJX0_BRACR|nr:hypothetical protein F2Q69_00024637 [Brassica cretica]
MKWPEIEPHGNKAIDATPSFTSPSPPSFTSPSPSHSSFFTIFPSVSSSANHNDHQTKEKNWEMMIKSETLPIVDRETNVSASTHLLFTKQEPFCSVVSSPSFSAALTPQPQNNYAKRVCSLCSYVEIEVVDFCVLLVNCVSSDQVKFVGDVWLSPVSITVASNQLNYFALTMKLKRRRLVHGSVKMESFSLGTTSMCSEADRVETMALDLACGMSFLDGLEEKPEAVRRRSRRRDVIKETSETQQV